MVSELRVGLWGIDGPGVSANGKRQIHQTIKPGLAQCGYQYENGRGMLVTCLEWTELRDYVENEITKTTSFSSRCKGHGGKYDADGKQILPD